MTIQHASDLHLEFKQNKEFLKLNPLQPKGDVLLLAGDIVPFTVLDQHNDFFNYISDHFKTTYWIPGNHEYYYFDLAEKCGIFNENIRSNVHLVNNVVINEGGINLIFSTMWSKISPANQWQIENGMSDFHVIKYNKLRFSAQQYNLLHEESLQFITSALQQKTTDKKIVVTHHAPTHMHYPEIYKGSALNEGFAVELTELINTTQPNYWIYGHHHYNTPDFNIGNTQLLTNQLGYVSHNEHLLFNTEKTIIF